jgi:hypothetical protein
MSRRLIIFRQGDTIFLSPLSSARGENKEWREVEYMECGFIDEMELNRVLSESTARATGGNWSFKRVVCIYETNYCTECGRCKDEDLDAEANSTYMKEAI